MHYVYPNLQQYPLSYQKKASPLPTNAKNVAALLLLTLCCLLPTSGQAKRTPLPQTATISSTSGTRTSTTCSTTKKSLAQLLGTGVSKKLRIVEKGDLYGIIYDRNGSALSSAKIAIHHNAILNKAGMGDARAIRDEGYHELYNVCYGHGPNLASLKKQYQTIYHYLGAEVGKNLYIEQTDDGNYTLIYRRQADRQSTLTTARRHAKLLRKKKIAASITREENNQVVFGESSFLDDDEKDQDTAAAETTTAKKPPLPPATTGEVASGP